VPELNAQPHALQPLTPRRSSKTVQASNATATITLNLQRWPRTGPNGLEKHFANLPRSPGPLSGSVTVRAVRKRPSHRATAQGHQRPDGDPVQKLAVEEV
jgi:hypothetical protein